MTPPFQIIHKQLLVAAADKVMYGPSQNVTRNGMSSEDVERLVCDRRDHGGGAFDRA